MVDELRRDVGMKEKKMKDRRGARDGYLCTRGG